VKPPRPAETTRPQANRKHAANQPVPQAKRVAKFAAGRREGDRRMGGINS